MQQRRLRLGDILDDYCPRERRITNHVVVAMIEDEVKQTRCSTCDADHEYKQAKAPASRRRKPAAALAGDLVDAPRPRPVAATRPSSPDHHQSDHDEPVQDDSLTEPADDLEPGFAPAAAVVQAAGAIGSDAAALDRMAAAGDAASLGMGGGAAGAGDGVSDESDSDGNDAESLNGGLDDDGPVHRPLIRATLPRPEGQTPERKEPDFTVRNGRGFDGNRDGNRNGHRQNRGQRQKQAPGHQGGRFGTPRQGSGQGQRFGVGHGSGQGHGQGQRHGNRQGQGQGQGQGGQRTGRPGGPGRGPRPGQGSGRGPKRGR